MKEFAGKVAVVTGAASGMGRAFAQRFAEEGMRVVVADIETPALDRAVGQLRHGGHEAVGVTADVSQPEAVGQPPADHRATGGDADGPLHLGGTL